MSTLKVDAIVDSSAGNTTTINGTTPTAYNTMGKNRIINGDMRIDQRNAGASVSVDNAEVWGVDRWKGADNSDGTLTMQQSTDVPSNSGFQNSLKITVGTADASLGSTQYGFVRQMIEGYNVADLAWGGASAKSVTVSFWVKASVAGTYSFTIIDSTASYSFPVAYTIDSVNTWEFKTVTITGATTGTWYTTNGNGMYCDFSIGAGSSYQSTSGTWASGVFLAATGQTNLLATSGNTFYITGVQLEVGSVATEFERRPYGTELELCKRYLQFQGAGVYGMYNSASSIENSLVFQPEMRTTPTFSLTTASITISNKSNSVTGTTSSASAVNFSGSAQGAYFAQITNCNVTSASAGHVAQYRTNKFMKFDAEL